MNFYLNNRFSTKRLNRWFVFIISVFFINTIACSQEPMQKQNSLKITINEKVFSVEVANSPKLRKFGLMGRESMNINQGMLFVFPEASNHCFWMKNTLIPLTILFIDNSGTVVSKSNMQPLSEQSHCAKQPVRYALEINQGVIEEADISSRGSIKGINHPIFAF